MSLADLIQALTLLIPILVAWRTARIWATLTSAGLVLLAGAGLNTLLLEAAPGLYAPSSGASDLQGTFYIATPTSHFITMGLVCLGLALPLWALERHNALLVRPVAWAGAFSLLIAQVAGWFLPRLALAFSTVEDFDQMRALFTKVNTASAALIFSMPLSVALLIAVMAISALRRR
ncbi:hypothetical protein [Aliiroseovarius sp.]|uniref:hypothetical protein n=1 Tax=Aliiroseovarius sp. TaxID=1872442 RepID=UPI003BAA931D